MIARALLERGFRVEGEVGIDLGRDAAGNELGDLGAESDRQAVGDGGGDRFRASRPASCPRQTAPSMTSLYCGSSNALSTSEGLVVQSTGRKVLIASRSPVSATTIVMALS